MKFKAMAAVVVLLLIGGWRYSDVRRQRAIGAAEQRAAAATVARDSLAGELAAVRARYRVDTVRLRETRTVRDTVMVTVTRWLRDSVWVPVEVVREIVAVDSAVIAACTIALRTCEQEKSLLLEDNRLIAQERDAYKVMVPTGGQRVRETASHVVLGVLIKVGWDWLSRSK